MWQYWVDRFGLATPVFGLVYFGSVCIDLFIFVHFQMFSMLIRKLDVEFKILNQNSWTKISKDFFYWKAYTFLGHPEPNRTEKWTFLDCLNRTDTEITILFKNRIMSFLFNNPRILKESWRAIIIVNVVRRSSFVRRLSSSFVVVDVTLFLVPPWFLWTAEDMKFW